MDPKTGDVGLPEEREIGESAPEPKVPPKNPRDIAIAEMAKRAQMRREKDEAAVRVDTLEEDGTITANAQPDEPPEVPITAAEDSNPPLETADAPAAAPLAAPEPAKAEEERELIVDGRRIRVPVSKILDAGTRALQKETAADMRLAAATELLRSAQERQVQPAVVQPSDDDAALARSIQFGTEEEAKAAIAKIRNATPAISQAQIEAFVQNKMAALPDHLAFHEANAWLKNEYSTITGDPELKFMFDMKEKAARDSGDRRPYKDLYADLAGQMATKFNLKKADKPEPAQPMTTQASDRLTRKANSPRPITGASGRVEQAAPPRKAMTTAEYVQRRRQASGMQPLDKQGI